VSTGTIASAVIVATTGDTYRWQERWSCTRPRRDALIMGDVGVSKHAAKVRRISGSRMRGYRQGGETQGRAGDEATDFIYLTPIS
jgi:hypothetical protein